MAGMTAKERYRFEFKMDGVSPENWTGRTIGLTNPPLKNRSGAGFSNASFWFRSLVFSPDVVGLIL